MKVISPSNLMLKLNSSGPQCLKVTLGEMIQSLGVKPSRLNVSPQVSSCPGLSKRVCYYEARLALMFNFCTYLVPSSSLPYMEQHDALTGSHAEAGTILLDSRNCEKL